MIIARPCGQLKRPWGLKGISRWTLAKRGVKLSGHKPPEAQWFGNSLDSTANQLMFAQCVEMKTPPTTKLQQMATETETNRKLHFRWRIVNQVNVKMSTRLSWISSKHFTPWCGRNFFVIQKNFISWKKKKFVYILKGLLVWNPLVRQPFTFSKIRDMIFYGK
jgi:hypothetical protein